MQLAVRASAAREIISHFRFPTFSFWPFCQEYHLCSSLGFQFFSFKTIFRFPTFCFLLLTFPPWISPLFFLMSLCPHYVPQVFSSLVTKNLPSLYNAQLTIIPPLSSAGLPVTPLQIGTSVRLTCLPFCQKKLGCPTFTFFIFSFFFFKVLGPPTCSTFCQNTGLLHIHFHFLPKSSAALVPHVCTKPSFLITYQQQLV